MTPDQYTNLELFLEVGNGHELYVHDWGNPKAKHVVFHLHGGPGGGCSDRHKGQYDPARQRVIFHDQRGAGRSLPHGSLDNNTTQNLVNDISKIADKLGIASFILAGGSWGSTLALVYGISHPKRVEAMVLDGIYTYSRWENDWLYQGQFQTFYPDAWDQFATSVPKSYRHEPTNYYAEMLNSDDPEKVKRAAYAYQSLQMAVMTLDDRHTPMPYDDYDPASSLIEMSYVMEDGFLPDRFILDNAHKLAMPVWLVQGRYDMVCPPNTAYELSKVLPNGELMFVTSGHKAERETWNIKRAILLQLTGTAGLKTDAKA